jgi:hypothetical protein
MKADPTNKYELTEFQDLGRPETVEVWAFNHVFCGDSGSDRTFSHTKAAFLRCSNKSFRTKIATWFEFELTSVVRRFRKSYESFTVISPAP